MPGTRDCDTCENDGECYVTMLQCKGYVRAHDSTYATALQVWGEYHDTYPDHLLTWENWLCQKTKKKS